MRLCGFFRWLVGLLAVVLFTRTAMATDDAFLWTMVSPNIPADAQAVFFLDAEALKSSALMAQLKPRLFRMEHGAAEEVERTCNVDLAASVHAAIVVVTRDEKSVFYLETNGIDLKRVTDCIKAMAAREKRKVKTTSRGAIVQVTSGRDSSYFGWVNGKVLVVADALDNRERLSKALTKTRKRFDAQPSVAAALARVNRAAMAWGVFVNTQSARKSDRPQRAYGSLSLVAGVASGEVRAVFASAEQAENTERELSRALAELKEEASRDAKRLGAAGAAASRILNTVRIAASANEVVGTASAKEADLIEVMDTAISGK